MPREEPFFRKCCFCIPLQSCLQVWSCIKSVADLTLGGFLTILVIILSNYGDLATNRLTLSHAFIALIPVLIVDSSFMVVLTVGLCTKNIRTLKVFLYYSYYMVSVEAVIFICFLVFGFFEREHLKVIYPSIAVCLLINAGLDVCIIFTLKSEMIKLRNKQQYEFLKLPDLNSDTDLAQPISFKPNSNYDEERLTESFQADDENIA